MQRDTIERIRQAMAFLNQDRSRRKSLSMGPIEDKVEAILVKRAKHFSILPLQTPAGYDSSPDDAVSEQGDAGPADGAVDNICPRTDHSRKQLDELAAKETTR